MASLDGVSLNLAAVGPVPSACPTIALAQSSTKRRNIIVAVALVLLVLLFGFWPTFEGAGSPMDEGLILVYPEMLLQGKLPYRDFETFYGPANPAFLAAAFSVFGTDIFVERAVGLLYRILILLAVFAIARHWGNTIGLCCLALTGLLLLGTYLPAYAWIGAIACALWSLWLSSRTDSHARCLFGGALAGLALLFRADIGPAMILATLPLFLGMTQSVRWKYLLGSGLALLPLAILTVFAGWRPVVDNLFLTPVLHSGPARHLPLLAVDSCILTLVVAHLIAASVNVVAGIVAVRSRPRDGHARLLLAVALFGLGLTHQTVNRPDSLHLVFVAFISLGILPLSLMLLGSRIRGVLPGRNEALFASITVVAVLQAIAPELTMMVRTAFWEGMHSNADTTFVQRDGRLFPFSSYRAANAVAVMLEDLNALSAPGERLFVGPADLRRTNHNDTYLYHLMPKLTPATYFLEMNPLSANRPGSRLAADVESADWLILNRAWDHWNEPNRSVEYGSNAANAVVQIDFVRIGDYRTFTLWRRKIPRTRPL
jgi:hypothetical protein